MVGFEACCPGRRLLDPLVGRRNLPLVPHNEAGIVHAASDSSSKSWQVGALTVLEDNAAASNIEVEHWHA